MLMGLEEASQFGLVIGFQFLFSPYLFIKNYKARDSNTPTEEDGQGREREISQNYQDINSTRHKW